MSTDCGVSACARTDIACDNLTGVQTDPQRERNAVVLLDVVRERADVTLYVERRQAGSKGMILQCDWSAEYGHDPIAGEFVDRPAVAGHHPCAQVEDATHHLA